MSVGDRLRVEQCRVCMPHPDHFWWVDGQRHTTDHPSTRYCFGRREGTGGAYTLLGE